MLLENYCMMDYVHKLLANKTNQIKVKKLLENISFIK